MKLANTYFIVVIEDTKIGKIIGTATAFTELKFIRGVNKTGHVEDVVVDSKYRGKDLGKVLMEQLKSICFKVGCYKMILDCTEQNVPFYEKCDFKRKEIQMALYKLYLSFCSLSFSLYFNASINGAIDGFFSIKSFSISSLCLFNSVSILAASLSLSTYFLTGGSYCTGEDPI